MKLNIVMISRAGSQKNIWDVCSESVESEGYKGDYMSNKVVFSFDSSKLIFSTLLSSW